MRLIETLKTLILEHKLIKRFMSDSGQMVYVEANPHSREGQGKFNLQRVDYDEILDSFEDIKDVVVSQANKIIKNCNKSNKECALIVRDNLLGFDYHFWIERADDKKMVLIVNTSIRHPRKLFNPHKSNIIIVDNEGSHTIIESFTNTKINGKFIQYYLFD